MDARYAAQAARWHPLRPQTGAILSFRVSKASGSSTIRPVKPYLEKPTVPEGATWTVFNRRLEDGIPFQWHYHGEYELTLTLNSRGQRFVGDHIGTHEDGDLVLLGANLPHTWVSSEKPRANEPTVAVVLWFRPDWLATLFETLPEFAAAKPMFVAAARGVCFSPAVAARASSTIRRMPDMSPTQRLIALLEVLETLSADHAATLLASPDAAPAPADPADRPTIEHVLRHIHEHYREEVRISTLAALACRSESRFHKLFRQHTRMTVLEYVTLLRVGQACSMLSGTDQPIARIAEVVGYGNLSHFNRKFRELKGITPREYRGEFRTR